MTAPARAGVTLIELLVALTLLGVMTAVVGVSIPRHVPATAADDVAQTIANARRTAISLGQSVSATVRVDSRPCALAALPDGSIIADCGLAIDRLSGAPMTSAH